MAYIDDLQEFCLNPPNQELFDYIQANTTSYNGKINYIAALFNVDIDVRKRQYHGLESARRHVVKAKEKFQKYYSVLKNQINGKSRKTSSNTNNKEEKFKMISHPAMESNYNQDDTMVKEISRIWNTGERYVCLF